MFAILFLSNKYAGSRKLLLKQLLLEEELLLKAS